MKQGCHNVRIPVCHVTHVTQHSYLHPVVAYPRVGHIGQKIVPVGKTLWNFNPNRDEFIGQFTSGGVKTLWNFNPTTCKLSYEFIPIG